MGPPAQPSLPADSNNEQIFLFLDKYKPGLCLPNNVLSNSSLYQYPPSKLHKGTWYILNLSDEKESIIGFWKVKEEACRIYSNTMISGWRTTLEYFEGKAPQVRKTDWLMQKYSITREELLEKNDQKVSISVCRVFPCNGSCSGKRTCPNCEIVNDSKKAVWVIQNTDSICEQYPRIETKEKREHGTIADGIVANNPFPEALEDEIFSKGDFLELNDLEGPESNPSSSQNSSCPSKLSDEYFDSWALLHDLEEDDIEPSHLNYSISRYSYTTSVRSMMCNCFHPLQDL